MSNQLTYERDVQSPIAPLELGRLSPTADRHEWLLNSEDRESKVDRVQAVMLIRDYIDSMPPTSASFTTRHLVKFAKEQGHEGITSRWFNPELLWLADCWEIPDHYSDGGRRKRFVSPKYTHRDRYSPVTVKCDCGGVVTKIQDSGSGYGIETEHTDDCFPGWRAKAAGVLMENRRVFLTRLALLAKSARKNHDLFHCDKNQVSHYVKSCGVDTQTLKRIGMNQRNNTFIELGRRGYSAGEIGRVYGLSAGRVREVISTDTGETLSELNRESK